MGQQGAWAYNHAAFTRTNGSGVSYTPPDGQYISWANSWSEVYRTEGEKHSDQGEGSYLDRPNGLLTRPDVAFLAGALNAAVLSANNIEAVFGPTMVYNRRFLQSMMKSTPDANANEWIDEQAGMLMKFGTPILSVSRLEELGDGSAGGGYLLQNPDAGTSAGAVAHIAGAAKQGRPILLSGRADTVHAELLKLAGATAGTTRIPGPAKPGTPELFPATLEPPPPCSGQSAHCAAWVGAPSNQTLSLSERVRVDATAEGKALAKEPDGNALLTVGPSKTVAWSQLNDLGGPEDISMAGFGSAGLYQAASMLVNAAQEAVVVSRGINATHPGTLHAWRSLGTVKLLLGNLEGAYCGGSEALPFDYSSGCSIPVEPEGGFAGGPSLSLEIDVNPAAMGLKPEAQCHWALHCLDGMRAPIAAARGGAVGWMRFAVALRSREAHAFELRSHCGVGQ